MMGANGGGAESPEVAADGGKTVNEGREAPGEENPAGWETAGGGEGLSSSRWCTSEEI